VPGSDNFSVFAGYITLYPPVIIYRDHPALLVYIDGDPVMNKIENSTYQTFKLRRRNNTAREFVHPAEQCLQEFEFRLQQQSLKPGSPESFAPAIQHPRRVKWGSSVAAPLLFGYSARYGHLAHIEHPGWFVVEKLLFAVESALEQLFECLVAGVHYVDFQPVFFRDF